MMTAVLVPAGERYSTLPGNNAKMKMHVRGEEGSPSREPKLNVEVGCGSREQ